MLVAQLPWRCFLLLLVGPDMSMLGYLFSNRVGAFTYNLLHHKGFALLVMMADAYSDISTLFQHRTPLETAVLYAGVILYGHA